jgi:hypothetical protein
MVTLPEQEQNKIISMVTSMAFNLVHGVTRLGKRLIQLANKCIIRTGK